MDDRPFVPHVNPTYGKDATTHLSTGHVGAKGELIAKRDVVTAHLGT